MAEEAKNTSTTFIPMIPLASLRGKDTPASETADSPSSKGKTVANTDSPLHWMTPQLPNINYLPWDDISLDDFLPHDSPAAHEDGGGDVPGTSTYAAPLTPASSHSGHRARHPTAMEHMAREMPRGRGSRVYVELPDTTTASMASDDLEKARGLHSNERASKTEPSSSLSSSSGYCGLPTTCWLFMLGFIMPLLWFIGSFWLASRHLRVRYWAWANLAFALASLVLTIVLVVK